MYKQKNLLAFIVFLGITCASFSQVVTTKKFDVNRDVDIIKVYEQYVEDGYGTAAIYKELATAYYFKSNYIFAKKWFEKLFEVEKPTDELLTYRYQQTLKALDLYTSPNVYESVSTNNN